MTDEQYIIERNKLIPEAVQFADKTAGPEPDDIGRRKEIWRGIWNKTFHSQMNILAKEKIK